MNPITIQAIVNVPIQQVRDKRNNPIDIMQRNYAWDDRHCPASTNDLQVGGKFCATMAAKDGSMSFDFGGVYDDVVEHQHIAYTMGDGRTCDITFTANGNQTHVSETFEMESMNPEEMQRGGWQAILDSFKNYTETNWFCFCQK